MKDENYIVIQGFMRNELNLKGNELMVYALIYGFTQDGDDEFTGSVGYIAEWIGATKQTVFNTLKTLCEKNLISKQETYKNGVKFCSYRTLPPVKIFDGEVVKNFDGGGKNILPNNIDNNINNNINNYKIVDSVIEQYNTICKSLPKCIRATAKRRNKIATRLDTYTLDDFICAFTKAEESEFLSGRSGKWNACNIDWFIDNDDNLTKVLEGKYNNACDNIKRAFMELEEEKNAERADDSF